MSDHPDHARPRLLFLRSRAGLVMLLASGLLAGLLAAPAPATAAVYTGTTSEWLTPTSTVERPGPRVRIGYVKVPSPGTYLANLSAAITDDSTDSVQYVAVSLICKEETTIRDQVGAAANVVRGETLTLNARVYFSIRKRGACFAYGTTMGLQKSSASLSSRRLKARTTLTISGPVSDATAETRRFVDNNASGDYAGRSFLAKPRVLAHAGELETQARPGSRALVTGNAYLTTCAFEGGSRDQTTNGKDLCTRAVVVRGERGTLARVRLVVRQYTPGGRVCATTVVPGSSTQVRITARRHHLPVAVKGDVTLADDAGCGSRTRAWTEVQVLDGPAVVVHFPSTVTAFRPT